MRAQRWTDTHKSGLADSDGDHDAETGAPPGPSVAHSMKEPLVFEDTSEAPAMKEAELKEVFKELGLKGQRRHRQNRALVGLAANSKISKLRDQRRFLGFMREDAANHSVLNLCRDLHINQNLDVLKKCIPKTSYYDENLLMEPESIATYLPTTVLTERADCGTHITNRHQEVQIVPDLVYEKRKVTLVRDARTTILDRVNLKRQLDLADVFSIKSPRKLPKLIRAASLQEETLPKDNQEFF